jgi:predicted nucleic acid-binding protein
MSMQTTFSPTRPLSKEWPLVPVGGGSRSVSNAVPCSSGCRSSSRVTNDAAVRAERLRRLSVVQHSFDALPLDETVAASYGLIAAVVAAGRQPRARLMDLLIAATAHAHGATLYTRHAGDLVGLESTSRGGDGLGSRSATPPRLPLVEFRLGKAMEEVHHHAEVLVAHSRPGVTGAEVEFPAIEPVASGRKCE